jgi:DNA-binding IclR family transcriptional regulator
MRNRTSRDALMSGDTTPEKMLRILDLIAASNVPVTTEAITAAIGFTRSTLYRYLKVLTESELITSLPEAGFTLGPRIAELDYRMRRTDPLIAASRAVMAELSRSERGLVQLCRRYKDKVLCIHQERAEISLRSHYARGLARPLHRGAASRIILACLKSTTINRLYAALPEEFAEVGLGGSVTEVRASLRQIRQQGWDVTHGQLTAGVTGVAAPIFDLRGEVLGSFSITVPSPNPSEIEQQRLIERIVFCTQIIQSTLSPSSHDGTM